MEDRISPNQEKMFNENALSLDDGERIFNLYTIIIYSTSGSIAVCIAATYFMNDSIIRSIFLSISQLFLISDRIIDQVDHLNGIKTLLGYRYYIARELCNSILILSLFSLLSIFWIAKKEGIRPLKTGSIKGSIVSILTFLAYILWLNFGSVEVHGSRTAKGAWLIILTAETYFLLLFYGILLIIISVLMASEVVILARLLFGAKKNGHSM